MKLLIKQRVFSWTDTYDIYDEDENVRYFVKGDFFSSGHRLRVFDSSQNEIGLIQEKLLHLLPTFEVYVGGQFYGKVSRKITFLRPKYIVDYNGWEVEGNIMGWEYDAYAGGVPVMHISKEIFHWGDTYVIDIANSADEMMALMLVLAIDAANCQS